MKLTGPWALHWSMLELTEPHDFLFQQCPEQMPAVYIGSSDRPFIIMVPANDSPNLQGPITSGRKGEVSFTRKMVPSRVAAAKKQ